jgi:tetratricopeptide (TPR) repeat protein
VVKGSPSGTANPSSISFRTIAPGALIFCATVLAFLPALSGDLIWNDSDYVTAPALRSLAGLARIWIDLGATEQYYPLLHSAFWVQHRLFGDHPFGYHVVTLLLHAGCAVLFALVLRRLFVSDGAQPVGAPAGIGQSYAGTAWLAGLLFALHPVHVESVAWIAEQKNTLSLAFYLAAAATYLRFDETRRPRTYGAALALFVASLACKTVTATLPAALLVIFWWKRGRLDWRRDVLPMLPWLALGATTGLFSSWVEQTYGGAQGDDFDLPVVGRVLVAGRAIWFYAGKLIWPFDLNFVYPRWTVDAAIWWEWLFPLGVLAVGAALWALRRRTRGPLAAFLFFIGSLFPVLGFVNLYGARFSWVWDHWQYLPDLGPLALAAAGLAAGWRRAAPRLHWLGPGLVAALAVLLGGLTWSHCGMFHDDETLYRTTIARNPGCWLAQYNLGVVWSKVPGRLNDAIAQFEKSLRLKPDYAGAHNNLGLAWSQMPGRLNDAIAQFKEVLRLKPEYAEAHNNLGAAWAKIPERLNDAIAQYDEALRLKPDFAEARNNLGNALSKLPGRLDDAVAQYQEALRLQPDFAEAHNNLGNTWLKLPGRLNDAIAQYQEALRVKPDYAEAHNNLGFAWSQLPGRLNDAIAEYEAALRLQLNSAGVHENLGLALSQVPGRLNDAIVEYEAALRLQPDSAAAHNNLGLAWSQMPGRLSDAAAQFAAALRLQPDSAAAHYNLGNVWSQVPGRQHDAIDQYQKALRLQPDFAPAWHNLGTVWFQLGNLPAAAAAFREELRLSPGDPAAQQALAAALQQVPDR